MVAAALLATLVAAPSALAAGWLPHLADATPTKEKVTVKEVKGNAFILGWTTKDLETPPRRRRPRA